MRRDYVCSVEPRVGVGEVVMVFCVVTEWPAFVVADGEQVRAGVRADERAPRCAC
jgi:hypothetical protein